MTNWGMTVRGICEVDGEILLLKVKSKSFHDGGKWELPGGKVKRNEFFDEALKREFLEETGLEIEVESLYCVLKDSYVACKSNEEITSVILIMNVTTNSMEVKISDEHQEYGWFAKDEIDIDKLTGDASKRVSIK